jgi:hypothetical protein
LINVYYSRPVFKTTIGLVTCGKPRLNLARLIESTQEGFKAFNKANEGIRKLLESTEFAKKELERLGIEGQ